ncbi:MAG: hypothetical protein ABI651_11970 [Verrucomicrobiota bacterium]
MSWFNPTAFTHFVRSVVAYSSDQASWRQSGHKCAFIANYFVNPLNNPIAGGYGRNAKKVLAGFVLKGDDALLRMLRRQSSQVEVELYGQRSRAVIGIAKNSTEKSFVTELAADFNGVNSVINNVTIKILE